MAALSLPTNCAASYLKPEMWLPVISPLLEICKAATTPIPTELHSTEAGETLRERYINSTLSTFDGLGCSARGVSSNAEVSSPIFHFIMGLFLKTLAD